MFFHFLSFSFIFQSFTFIFFHFNFSFFLSGGLKIFFLGLNFGTISRDSSELKNQLLFVSGVLLWALFFFFSFFFYCFFFCLFSCFFSSLRI